MKPLHDGKQPGKAAKPAKSLYPRVEHLRQLLGHDVLMLAWPLGKKGDKTPWGHLTLAQMDDPAYLRKLEGGNIGIALGEKSNGLCSIDWDSEEWMFKFLEANPALQKSLRTRGARGCNVWVRIIGNYPPSFKIKTKTGEAVGEWRANGNQTIISGQHPSGCEYSIRVDAPPLEIDFASLEWPEGLRVRRTDEELPIAHSALSPTAPTVLSALSCSLKLPQVVWECFVSFDVSPFIPAQRGQTDRCLWAMAGRMKTVEKRIQRPATITERTIVFKAWWPLSKPHVDPDMDSVAYLAKWLGDCDRRKFADDETALTAAWGAAQSEPLPPEATTEHDMPISQKMQQLVALCYQLQLNHGNAPFFLGSRDAGRLLETAHRTVAYWLEILANEDGPFRILKKVRAGSHNARRTNEYLYLSHDGDSASPPAMRTPTEGDIQKC